MNIKRIKSAFLLCLIAFATALPASAGETGSPKPQTLLQIVGVQAKPARLSESVLIIIDAQREYLDGRLRLDGIDASIEEAARVLKRARQAGTPVIHVVHKGKPGGSLFDPNGPSVEIVPALAPHPGETVVSKTLPNAFAGTSLDQVLARLGRKNLIVIGYMTHMCVSSTVRAALDRGYQTTVVAGATADRSLPDSKDGAIPAEAVQRASLAALADRFATVVQRASDLPD